MDLARAVAYSRYAQRCLAARPALRDTLEATLAVPFDVPAAAARLPTAAPALGPALRDLRTRALLGTLLRDLTGRADLAEVGATMTALADAALAHALAAHDRELATVHGAPRGSDSGERQSLIVVGMGKLGGGELNVSSDIDLVFVYPEEGETDGARSIANREYFDRLGKRLIATLAEVTADGFVFRVDMRLRPYGTSGPLTTSFAGLETYLVTQGRMWERYAWLKARAITGESHDELDALIAPFVFRKYLDYDAYEGLRDLHRQIREQGARRDAQANVKLGDGGIREIEFIVQAQQIVRGGREPDLRARGTLPALAALAERDLLPHSSAATLRDAYVFLRNVEHRLQYRDDAQTHHLPADPGELAWLAETMGTDAAGFTRALAQQRRAVSVTFGETFAEADEPATVSTHAGVDGYAALWLDPRLDDADEPAALADAGFADPPALVALLTRVRASARYQQLPAVSRERFDVLVPRFLAAAAEQPGLSGAQAVFERLLALLESVARRSAYLALLIEHPPLLPRIATLMSASAWAAEYLTRYPLLLDELLDAPALLAEPSWDEWRSELAQRLGEFPGDTEQGMDVLRHFQHAQTFRLLAQDLAGHLTVERLADHLSALADIVLDGALAACWACLKAVDAPAPRFAIVGYGKLGGKELGYVSDLDIVFIFDIADDDPDADAHEIAYTRLAQRLNTWLTSTTPAGPLYDTDLRLRPDGAKGLLASSLRGFVRYQREQAWVWEHQALTRARFVAGDAAVGAAFEAARQEILTQPRDPAHLVAEIVAMRRRMAAGHANPTPLFDLKHDDGGMVDIEFTVQCLVLGHAHRHRALTRNAGNIALLHLAAELDLIARPLAHAVADAYREYRRLQHQVRLTGAEQARVDPLPQIGRREAVTTLWAQVFGGAWRDAGSR
ncbi:MAG: bifunctional [glutamate--ammonia ligase]-adenylyl-L-tyrosine phosphorylase/[glutamate--ammonia-ligase] adenylyltransferase [Burkholderiales bacterium]|nr:bifunctional [glutamate--ammonia ligase]-adenylyl-L-tyrosine phosphorylase/[glutamate--ammonia-ligase] adenylyltransferase [Burkholderiales bacterium]